MIGITEDVANVRGLEIGSTETEVVIETGIVKGTEIVKGIDTTRKPIPLERDREAGTGNGNVKGTTENEAEKKGELLI